MKKLLSLLPSYKLREIEYYLKKARDIEGAVGEVGVYKGGFIEYICDYFRTTKNVFGFDTFAGMPIAEKEDKHQVGDFADTKMEDILEYLTNKYPTNVRLYRGIFPYDFNLNEFPKFSFMHLDVDNFIPTLSSLVALTSLMTRGGIVIVDDYYYPGCEGVERAVREILKQPNTFEVLRIPSNQIVLRKL